jgi:1,4-dihydroxy-2-naphthoyl-CoA synthase
LCEPISAQTALEWGLINGVVPAAELDAAVREMAGKLLDKMPEIMRYAKHQTNFWRELSWNLTVQHARDWLSVHADAAETAEGLAAFYEKRGVNYGGLRQQITEGGTQCGNCGAVMPAGYKFCGNCGQGLPGESDGR